MCSKFWFSRCREKFENITQIETNGQIKRPSLLLSSLNFLERRYGKVGTLVILGQSWYKFMLLFQDCSPQLELKLVWIFYGAKYAFLPVCCK